MSIFNIQWPPGVQSTIQTALDSIMTNVEGRQCVLYFPPTYQSIIAPTGFNPVADISNNAWTAGMPMPIYSQQGFAGGYGDASSSYAAVEITGTVTMVVYQNPALYNQVFPKGTQYEAGQIMTRGFITDLQSILNCTRMETFIELGQGHYKYKRAGEPVSPSKIIQNRWFYCLWSRL